MSQDVLATPDHLVGLSDGWLLWKAACLRGAGLPVHWLERQAAPEAAAAVDRLLEAEAAWEAARQRALEGCRAAIEALAPKARKGVQRAIKALKGGRVPPAVPERTELSPLFEALGQLAAARAATAEHAESSIAAGRQQVLAALQDIGREPLFREALLWQNRQALHDSVDVLLRMGSAEDNGARRRHEGTVCNYLQRYCAKNDTIGFFGPASWLSFEDSGPALTMKPGPSLIADRWVHFEYWAVNALAETLGQDPALRAWMAPRLAPTFRLDEDGRLYPRGRGPVRLVPEIARLLAACDGRTPAREIVARLLDGPGAAFRSPAEGLQHLAELAARRVLVWNAAVPVVPQADQRLRALLQKVGDRQARERALAKLDTLQQARAAVEAARGDLSALDRTMGALEDSFAAITQSRPTRYAGATYGGRTLLYEDCRRDIDLTIGPEVRDRLGPPFALLLQSANWYLGTIGSRFTAYLNDLYDRAADAGGGPVELQTTVFGNPEVAQKGRAIIDGAIAEHGRRWQAILGLDEAASEARFSVEALRERVDEVFPCLPLRWPGARYHSPDRMIAAESAEGVRAGHYQLVLGEFNAGINRLALPLFCRFHPQPMEVARFLDADLQRPRVLMAVSRDGRGLRVVPETIAPRDYHLTFVDTPSWRAPEQVLPASALVVERGDDGLIVRTRDGRARFLLADFYTMLLGRHYWDRYGLLPPRPHLPRIVFGDLVVAREKWRFPCGDLAFAGLASPEQRFIGARRWKRTFGLPRRVFALFAFERKPVYVDFDSPVSLEAFAKLVRRGAEEAAAEVVVSEMLPTPEQCWLADAAGNRYTSELRLAALHPDTWRPDDQSATSRR